MSSFENFQCPYCKKFNSVYLGNPRDLTQSDVDMFRCWNCGKLAWTTEDPLIRELAKESPHIEEGRKIL